ncbi:MAG: hypothetical protein Q8L41_11810 [Anaerolineales bacterium]|nr:hypothetical protein [Anaerolineales bacterium]
MNIKYLMLRVLRHFMPEALARFLLKHRWIIRPGLESSDPSAAVDQYIKTLSIHGESIQGKRVLVFGYGGRFAVAVELLRRGAAHVALCDHFVLLDQKRNLELLPDYSNYLFVQNDRVMPHPEFITLFHGDIRADSIQKQISEVDYVLSTSVYEHLDDVDGITRALAKLTAPTGTHLHFVDLRDHYFKYPFEMLTFSERVWRNFLNPTSNLNRFRLTDYREVFGAYFQKVNITVLERLEDEFRAARPRIRPEFLTGDEAVDSVALIHVLAEVPKR